ncbi:LAG1-domain-containing protein [Polychaeton citri CBS 116435]|uniref:LAG1-domain-containing protein n=1 Tax=Polychaeton citri CBS 116435 TaxID=1314669 RepID=A0A9P4Q7R0_9PEZI|nr:LAG1-domain-containing protein [Polychaeton citri CBS 116435]
MEQANASAGLPDGIASDAYQKQDKGKKEQRSEQNGAAVAAAVVPMTSAEFMAARRRKSNQPVSLGSMLRRALVDHQLGLSVNFMLLVAMTYVCFPPLRKVMAAFLSLSYPAAQEGQWTQGSKDMCLVASFIVLFTAVRAACLDYFLLPIAGLCGIEKKKARVRFAEQGHLLLYYLVYWSWGVYLFVQDTPVEVNSANGVLISIWRDFPRLTTSTGMKLYYLSQFGFWVQQIAVINIEEPRNDYYQMLTHHFITIALMGGSHWYRQHRAGNAFLVLMDVVDLLLPTAKIFRYLNWQFACDCTFGLFVICWLAARHLGYLAVCWSIYAHVNTVVMPHGTYSVVDGQRLSPDGGKEILGNLLQPLLNPSAETVAFNSRIQWQFLGLLLALQCVTIGWFVMICRVVAGVLRGKPADDTRSDDEDEEEEEEEEETPPPRSTKQQAFARYQVDPDATAGAERTFIEVDSTSEDYSRPTSAAAGATRSKRKSKGFASGINLGEHKDILNRIGCLSDEQLAREREKREESLSPRPSSSTSRR